MGRTFIIIRGEPGYDKRTINHEKVAKRSFVGWIVFEGKVSGSFDERLKVLRTFRKVFLPAVGARATVIYQKVPAITIWSTSTTSKPWPSALWLHKKAFRPNVVTHFNTICSFWWIRKLSIRVVICHFINKWNSKSLISFAKFLS